MDCDRVAREELLEGYLLGRLREEDCQALEEHYFECPRCFDDLQSLQAIRAELRLTAVDSAHATPRRMTWLAPALAVAAAIVLASAVVLWRGAEESIAPPGPGTHPSASSIPAPDTPRAAPPPATPRPSLAELARVEPAPYEPLTFRSAPAEAMSFRRGMERYRQADYRGAIVDLRAAQELDPDAPHVHFFLGVSHLLLGEDADAIDQLRTTIALADSPYLDEAHLYLAKAFLRQKNLDAAERQLRELIALGGSRSGEARRLITQLEKLREP